MEIHNITFSFINFQATNTTTSNGISSILLTVPYQLNIYFGSFLWMTGNIGCIGNIIVFRSQAFRKRAYSIYLLSEAASEFIYFNFVLMTRILQKGFQIPLTTRYDVICKLRQFFSVWGNQISLSWFLLATIDRLLSAQRNNAYRRWSNNVGLAYKMCITCILFWLLFYGHRLILYSAASGACVPLSGFYDSFDTYLEAIFTALCPPIMMVVLTYFLLKSVRGVIQRQIFPVNNRIVVNVAHRSVLQQMDSRLTLMLLLQSIIAIITYVPFAIELIYSNVTQNRSKSSLRLAQEKVFIEFARLLSYTFFASSFYVSIISNIGFRRQMKKFFRKLQRSNHETGENTTCRTSGTNIDRQQK
ncbi:unnamed protein product [Rotaria magnacalcarata]|uniref:G-protein coupled receptors family 1 profile domain-containing protein n=3 Tax=Rotaria magnacalcarata TaxID=392030 RepID=A0A816QNH8_9BILA|nr:unnamed protein product [Rotaria magnacalcarata]CAF4274589.1 unnamed protein product [Rotaria magnacalcarata]